MTEQAFITKYRQENKLSRATRAVKYIRNGTTTKQEQCLRCGETGPTWCARYRKTKTAAQWEDAHRSGACSE